MKNVFQTENFSKKVRSLKKIEILIKVTQKTRTTFNFYIFCNYNKNFTFTII